MLYLNYGKERFRAGNPVPYYSFNMCNWLGQQGGGTIYIQRADGRASPLQFRVLRALRPHLRHRHSLITLVAILSKA